MKKVFVLYILISTAFGVFGQDLSIGPNDIRLEHRADEGLHLFIRRKPDIRSVLLVESTRDPSGRADNFAYRAPEWNPINGNEIRILDGAPIPRESRIFSLIDSTPEIHPELGEAFHIFIPWIVTYGFPYTRHGEVNIAEGAYINIRTFNYPYADYRGSFRDNPFTLQAVPRERPQRVQEPPRVVQEPPRVVQEPQIVVQEEPQETQENDEGAFISEAERSFSEIASEGHGEFIQVADPRELVEEINEALKNETGRNVDIVLCVDATGSMGPYINAIREMLIPMMRETVAEFTEFRIGMVLYRDYGDEFLTRVIPFTSDFSVFQRNLNAVYPKGGGDIPEAVYEGLYEAADKFPWAAESRLIILIGDAPPHPQQRGAISKEMVYEMVAEKDIKVTSILLPH